MSLESMRLNMELMRVKAAKAEMEFKIAERLEDIKRIEESMKVQDAKIEEIELKLIEVR
jgi:hypothetical protein